MNNSYVYVGIGIAIVIVGTLLIFQFESKNPTDTYTSNSDISSMGTDRLSSTNGTKIISEPVSCHIQKKVLDAIGHLYKTPQVLPTGYSLQDGDLFSSFIHLYYAKGPICGSQVNQTIKNGIIHFLAENMPSETNETAVKSMEQMKNNSQRGDLMSVFEINGNPAIGWESGTKYNVAMWDNGTTLSKTPTSYPAEIQIMSPSDKVRYTIGGYFSLDDLKLVAKSIG